MCYRDYNKLYFSNLFLSKSTIHFFSFLSGPVLVCLLLSKQKETHREKVKFYGRTSIMHKLLQIIPVIWNKVVKMKSIKIIKGDTGLLERIASQGPLVETGWVTSILDTLGKVLHLLVHKEIKKKLQRTP